MADSWRQALLLLRSRGPFYAIGFAGRRLATLARLRHAMGAVEMESDLDAAISLMIDRPLGPPQAVFSMQRRSEIKGLLQKVEALQAQTVVEIGTAAGGTLFLFTRVASSNAHLVSIDLPGGRFGGGYQAWRKPLYRSFARARQRISLIRGSSRDPAVIGRLKTLLAGKPIDFLFIDGDHSYAGVKADFEMFAPMVRRGGLIALHDIRPLIDQPDIEVPRFWAELRLKYGAERAIELVDDAQQSGYGIGLLEV